MAQISIEELYRGEGGGEKYGAGGIMGAVIKDLDVYKRQPHERHDPPRQTGPYRFGYGL